MSQDTDPASESNPSSSNKIEAIYALREAAEAKALAEVKADAEQTPAARDELLAAQLDLESKTQDAVESCHECGHSHGAGEPHYTNNVVALKNTDRTRP